MMKENLKQMTSFITFELPIDTRRINSQFTNTHYQYLTSIPYWSSKATRRKIIARYWFNYVCTHFGVLLALAALIALPFINKFDIYYFPSLWIVGIISFSTLLLLNYWPHFYCDFLPKLDSIIDNYEKENKSTLQNKWITELQNKIRNEYDQLAIQREELVKERQLIEALKKEQVKCRKEQFQTLTLALIFYVFDKTSGLNGLQCNDQFASLLTKLFGKDPGGIRDSLELIFAKKPTLSPRQRTEILNRFNDAYEFLQDFNHTEGIRILRSLEANFTKNSN
jgi:hypothetical protein